jgi:enoyl-CoA hydratase/carnithine racemase
MEQRSGQHIGIRLDERPQGLVATVVIDNARRLNTLNSALMTEFIEAMAALAANSALRALVLTGAGDKAFIGGADINEMAAIRDGDAARAFIARVHGCCDAVRAIPVPTIARIQGLTFGAGLELAASCDLRVAADTALFGMPEVKLGIPSVVEAALLPTLVGWGRTREMLLFGETFGASQALEWRLVERVTPAAQLDDAVETWIGHALGAMPGAIRLQKALIRSWEDLPLRAAIRAGIDAFAAAYDTGEPAVAMGRFLAEQAARKKSSVP